LSKIYIFLIIRLILVLMSSNSSCFFAKDTPTPDIYTLSLHDALPIYFRNGCGTSRSNCAAKWTRSWRRSAPATKPSLNRCALPRSEEHTSELQSLAYLVCRLLLEKKKHTFSSSVRLISSPHSESTRRP